MARYFSLCLVLMLWMDGSRWSAAIRSGSSGAGLWWGSRESRQLVAEAARLRGAGDYAAAETLYQRQLELARRAHDEIATIRSLFSIGAVRILESHYRAALDPLLDARRRAQSIGDRLDLGAVDYNLSSLYLQMWDVDSAMSMAEEGAAASDRLAKAYYRHLVLLMLGRLHQSLGDGEAEAFFQQGIEASLERGDAAQEAIGWDLLGDEWLRHGQLGDSERALDQAYRIRILHDRADVPFSYARLGQLKLAEGDLPSAQRFTDLAFASGAPGQAKFPEHLLLHQRGSIRLAQGDVPRAIDDFRAAAERAAAWQQEVLPASSILTASNSELEKQVFDSFIETAAHEAIRTGDPALARESFAALEWNRAQSLRETVGLAEVWRQKLPAAYWDTLARARKPGAPARDLNLKLTEMEAQAGLHFLTNHNENFFSQGSLTVLRKGLSNSDLLLSFHLGSEESYVWALTRQSLNLYALAPARQIRSEIQKFRSDVENGRAEAWTSGSELYEQLFGKLSRREFGKGNWLLSLDEALFETPLSALRWKDRYLVEMHSLTVLPGALWSSGATETLASRGWFLGVGDAIYNTADPRWSQTASRSTFEPAWFEPASLNASVLNRLVSSSSEVELSARSWSASREDSADDSAIVLRGAEARRKDFMTLARHNPAIIHLATHVLTPESRRGQARIVFGLEPSGTSGYLTTADVGMLDVRGSVVTMTGCETGGGEALAGAGLLGLTRAWQVAGARAVVSTLWPVRDSAGDLFAHFYQHLKTLAPAEALRESQAEMIQSGTWRAEPRYWAAYQVTGGHLSR